MLSQSQKKRGKYDRHDDKEEKEEPAEDPIDELKDATTLYVGNLYGVSHSAFSAWAHIYSQILLYN